MSKIKEPGRCQSQEQGFPGGRRFFFVAEEEKPEDKTRPAEEEVIEAPVHGVIEEGIEAKRAPREGRSREAASP